MAGTAKTTPHHRHHGFDDVSRDKVWVVGELQDSADNIANAFWDSLNLALDETEMALPTVHAILAKKPFLRYESPALPDMENLKVECMVRKSDNRYQTQGPNDKEFLQDPLTKSLLSLFAANNELDSVVIDEFAAEEQEQLQCLQAFEDQRHV